MGAIVLVAARLIGTTQLHQLAYVMLLLPVAALVLGFLGSRGLRLERRVAGRSRVVAGVPAEVEISLKNHSRFGTSFVEVTDNLPERRELEFEPLESGDSTDRRFTVKFPRRGVYRLGPAETSVVDPFELVKFTRTFPRRTEVVVYPEVHELRGFPVRGGDADAGGRGTIGQRGDEFAGLREYRRGDDRRHIHWKSVARTGELYVKEFSLHAPKRYTVALDLRRSGLRVLEGPVEDAVSAAASVLSHLRSEGLPARLLSSGKRADGAGSEEHGFSAGEAFHWREMRLLATVRADGGATLAESVLDDRENLGEGVILVSRNVDEDLLECSRRLIGGGVAVVAVLIASHTYATQSTQRGSERASEKEISFSAYARSLERAGVVVRVVRSPERVAGFAEGRGRVSKARV